MQDYRVVSSKFLIVMESNLLTNFQKPTPLASNSGHFEFLANNAKHKIASVFFYLLFIFLFVKKFIVSVFLSSFSCLHIFGLLQVWFTGASV